MEGDKCVGTEAALDPAAVNAEANAFPAPPDTYTANVSIQGAAGFSAPAPVLAQQASSGNALPAQRAYPQQAPGYYFAPPPPGQPMPFHCPPGQPPPGQPMPVQYQPGVVMMPAPTPQGPPVYMVAPQPLYGQPPQPVYVQTAAPMYVQQFARRVGYEEGTCACGGDLGQAQWTIVAWLLCFFFCPFNFCIPQCMPMTRSCKQCGRTYEKPF